MGFSHTMRRQRRASSGTARPSHNRVMAGKRGQKDDELAPYRKVRKPVPPPGRVIPDRRRKLREDEAERERREREGR